MSLPRRFYNMKHENNTVIVSAKKGFTFYTDLDINNHYVNVKNPRTRECPWVFIACELFHRVVSPDREQVLHEEHFLLAEFCSTTANFATVEQCRSSIQNVLSRTRLPFNLDGRGGQLLWKERVRMHFDRSAAVELHDWDDVVDRASEVAGRIVGVVTSAARPVTSVEMKISFSKLTFVENDVFDDFYKNDECLTFADEDEDEDEDDNVVIIDESSIDYSIDYDSYADEDDDDNDNYNKIGFVLESAVYGGAATEVSCPICRDVVVVGTNIAILPCAHIFHIKCIDPWMKKKTTCPTCRFDLLG